ncbi:VWA domain-containing protein [Vibrio kyushuensis]|uniref:vWA domain-containing protein n=1 Tax=Vibrio kyushuensis TaxID=2910249 RepID=UPI003D114D68
MNIFDNIAAFHFLRPLWLIGVGVIILLYWTQLKTHRRLVQWEKIIEVHLLEHLVINAHRPSFYGPVQLLLVTGLILFVALAGPTWARTNTPLSQDKAAMVIVLDVSLTMQQTDVEPTRLDRVKQKVAELLEARGNASVSLIAYAGSAHTVLPLTNDTELALYYLDAISADIMPSYGKREHLIPPVLTQLLTTKQTPATIVLFTDGVSQTSTGVFQQYLEHSSHQLLVIGIGKTNATSDSSIIPLIVDELEQFAVQSGGRYFTSTIDKTDVNWILRRAHSHYLLSGDHNSRPWKDSGYYLVFLLMLLTLNWFRKGWSLTW